jgi:hypothetical protein
MYDVNFQCAQEFHSLDVVSCDTGPETNCKALHCEYKPKECAPNKPPPADGNRGRDVQGNGAGYVKITTIHSGSTKISIEEM